MESSGSEESEESSSELGEVVENDGQESEETGDSETSGDTRGSDEAKQHVQHRLRTEVSLDDWREGASMDNALGDAEEESDK